MKYNSTRNNDVKVASAEAIAKGLSPDGGLFVPEEFPHISEADIKSMAEMSYKKRAEFILGKYLTDFTPEELHECVSGAYGAEKFGGEDTAPLHKLCENVHILELWHGPTCAFKDMALQILPHLLTRSAKKAGIKEDVAILVATSGDTGKAALDGFRDVDGTKIIVFFPADGVSRIQKLQMVTQDGKNTCAVAVRGNFDDAQSGVKKLFREIPKPCDGVSLSSANSINIGRLVPQVVYYFSAYRQLLDMGEIQDGDKVNFVVPTGNFGDIMAGYFAREMGLPVGRLVCASNCNDVLREFLETGHYNRKRDFHKTTSPSMDILVSSNLERLLCFVCGVERTRIYMDLLAKQGEYTITEDELKKINEVFSGVACDDARGAKAIGDVFRAEHYLMDTHTAIAWAAYEECRDKGEEWTKDKTVVLSTASPYKFTRAVLAALGKEECPTDEDCMQKLKQVTQVEAPAPLQGIFERPICHTDVIDVPDMKSYVVKHAEK